MAQSTDACEDLPFIEISARRVPQMDKYYHGRAELEWDNPADRIALVKEGGFYCLYDVSAEECEACPANDYCYRYQD